MFSMPQPICCIFSHYDLCSGRPWRSRISNSWNNNDRYNTPIRTKAVNVSQLKLVRCFRAHVCCPHLTCYRCGNFVLLQHTCTFPTRLQPTLTCVYTTCYNGTVVTMTVTLPLTTPTWCAKYTWNSSNRTFFVVLISLLVFCLEHLWLSWQNREYKGIYNRKILNKITLY